MCRLHLHHPSITLWSISFQSLYIRHNTVPKLSFNHTSTSSLCVQRNTDVLSVYIVRSSALLSKHIHVYMYSKFQYKRYTVPIIIHVYIIMKTIIIIPSKSFYCIVYFLIYLFIYTNSNITHPKIIKYSRIQIYTYGMCMWEESSLDTYRSTKFVSYRFENSQKHTSQKDIIIVHLMYPNTILHYIISYHIISCHIIIIIIWE